MATTLQSYANAELDRAYTATAGTALAAIMAISRNRTSRIQRALLLLDTEADTLSEQDEPITGDNAVLRAALADFYGVMDNTEQIISANAEAVQMSGARVAPMVVTAGIFAVLAGSLARAGRNPVSPQAMRYYEQEIVGGGLPYRTLTDDALSAVTGYVRSDAWIQRMSQWGDGYAGMVEESILNGIQQGWNPVRTARELRRYCENMPTYASENMMRTLQLTAYRDAEVEQIKANSRYVVKKYRIAALDDRTCISCVALHGTELAIDERVDDHFNGRCSSVLQVEGQPSPITQTGEEWFNSLSPDRQQQQASFVKSPGKWRAFQDGTPLSAFVGEHHDPVFGRQAVELSMTRALGADRAAEYYERNQQ